MPRRPDSLRTTTPRARRGRLALLAVLLFGCGRGALGPAEDPGPRGQLLLAPAERGHLAEHPEVLRAEVEAFGLQIASLQSSLCPATLRSPGSIETRVTSAPLVNVIRRTSGEAKTQLSELSAGASEYNFRDGDLLRHYQVEYGAGTYTYAYDNGGPQQITGHNAVPEGASPHDLHSAMLLLRSWRPRLEEAAYFYVVLGRKLWRVDVTAEGPQVIKAQGAPRLTHRIDGVAVRLGEAADSASRRFSLWLSEDAARVPVRMVADASFGEITMTLIERELGAADCAPRAVARAASPAPEPASAGLLGAAWHAGAPVAARRASP